MEKTQTNSPPAAGDTPDTCHPTSPRIVGPVRTEVKRARALAVLNDTQHRGMPGREGGGMEGCVCDWHGSSISVGLFCAYNRSLLPYGRRGVCVIGMAALYQ